MSKVRGGLYYTPMGPNQAVNVFPNEKFPDKEYHVDVDEIAKSLYALRDSPVVFHFTEKSDDPEKSPPVVDGLAWQILGYLIAFKGARLDLTTSQS